MGTVIPSLALKQVIAIAVTAIVLSVIFVPFQLANAFEVDLELPEEVDLDAVPTSAVGSTFTVTIDVASGELISVDSIELILDNGLSSVKRAMYDTDGQRISGSPTLTRGNLDITLSGSIDDGYGYGYGYVSDGTTFSPSYSYSFSYSNSFISGNSGGASNPVGNDVTGILGPGAITIEGKLNTAQMEEGVPHTLDVLINTGTGVNPDHIVAPQLTLTTTGNSAVAEEEVEAGDDVEVEFESDSIPAGKLKMKMNLDFPGSITAEAYSASVLNNFYNALFESLTASGGKFSIGSFEATTMGDIFDIDASDITIDENGFTITVNYSEDDIPPGVSESELALFHYDTIDEEWEDITTELDTEENLIIGETDTLSPIAVGFYSSSGDDDDDGPSGGRGGGGGGGTVIINQTFPPSHFIDHPLDRVQIDQASVFTVGGISVVNGRPGQQVDLTAGFKNFQTTDQDYAIIFVVIDEDGITSEIGWITGTLASGESTQASRSWSVGPEGNYTIKIFVWNGVTELPTPLSEVKEKSFTSS